MKKKIGQCKLCLTEGIKFSKSHIIPKFLFKELKGEDGKDKIVEIYPNKEYRKVFSSDNFYDLNILCSDCESLLSKNETYLNKFLSEIIFEESNLIEKTNKFSIIHINNIDSKKLKLGLLSILWRSDITEQKFFSEVSLGPHSEYIRNLILKDDFGGEMEYPLFISVFNTENDLKNIILPIEKSKTDGITQYTYIINKFGFYFCVGSIEKMNNSILIDCVPNFSNTIKIILHKDNYGRDLFESYFFKDIKKRPKYQ
jgi:hypothetical protein